MKMIRKCAASAVLCALAAVVCINGYPAKQGYPPELLPLDAEDIEYQNDMSPLEYQDVQTSHRRSYVGPSEYQGTCKQILAANPRAPSGVYNVFTPISFSAIEIYCEMGLNGGGYTFLNPMALSALTDRELQLMFTDKSSFLMRTRKCDGTQPFTVLSQLPAFSSIPLKLGLSQYNDYTAPINTAILGAPYLYFGFIPRSSAAQRNQQGLRANGAPLTFNNGDANPNSHITLFANFAEKAPSTYSYAVVWPFGNALFASGSSNPSTRVMPPEYFMFTEAHFGGGGCYVQTDGRTPMKCIQGTSIGFR